MIRTRIEPGRVHISSDRDDFRTEETIIVTSKIGSDREHTKWCRQIAMREIKVLRKRFGYVWVDDLSPAMRRAYLGERLANLVLAQDNEDAPLWRLQELLRIGFEMLEEGS